MKLTSPPKVTRDFKNFSPSDYLKEYYSELGEENKFLLHCYHNFYSKIEKQDRMLEIGGGPTIYSLISASSKVENITFAEYNIKNRNSVEKWQINASDAFNWQAYFSFVRDIEAASIGKGKEVLSIDEIQQRLRRKLTEIIPCNLFTKEPLLDYKETAFNIVSSNFCSESITDDQQLFTNALSGIIGLVKQGGYILLSMLKGANYYKVGNKFFPAYKLYENDIINILKQNSFDNIQIETIAANPKGKGYEGIIVVNAIKL